MPDGRTAIDRELIRVYGDLPVSTLAVAPRPGEAFALDSFYALRIASEAPHWLIVSRGFTELDDKVEQNPNESGFGFELVFRVTDTGESTVPTWSVDVIIHLASYLVAMGTTFEPFDNFALGGSVVENSALTALLFVDDPLLHETRSENGAFRFLQAVALTDDELQACEQGSASSFADLLRELHPLGIVDPRRSSSLDDPAFAERVRDCIARDGSSLGMKVGLELSWVRTKAPDEDLRVHISLGRAVVPIIIVALRARLSHGRTMLLMGDPKRRQSDGAVIALRNVNVLLAPHDSTRWFVDEAESPSNAQLVLKLDGGAQTELLERLRAEPGTYEVPSLPGVRFEVR